MAVLRFGDLVVRSQCAYYVPQTPGDSHCSTSIMIAKVLEKALITIGRGKIKTSQRVSKFPRMFTIFFIKLHENSLFCSNELLHRFHFKFLNQREFARIFSEGKIFYFFSKWGADLVVKAYAFQKTVIVWLNSTPNKFTNFFLFCRWRKVKLCAFGWTSLRLKVQKKC